MNKDSERNERALKGNSKKIAAAKHRVKRGRNSPNKPVIETK